MPTSLLSPDTARPRTAAQLHGAMGMNDLLRLHFWLKRIRFSRQVLGSSERLRQPTAQLQGFGAPAHNKETP